MNNERKNEPNLDLITELFDKVLPFLKNSIAPKWRQLFAWSIAATVLTAVALYAGVTYPIPPAPVFESPVPADEIVTLGTTHFTNIEAEDITATDDLVVTDDTTLGGDLALTGALAAGGSNTLDLVIFEHTALTVTTTTITPTHTFYSLDSSAAATITLAASGTEGQLLVLINDDANAVIIADTNLVSADGNAITMTNADDTAILIYQDDKWHELASLDGS